MSEDTSVQGGESTGEPTSDSEDEFTPITSQDELDARIGRRLSREREKFADYEDLKAKSAQFDELEEAKKTEAQKLSERAEVAEGKLQQIELNQLRRDVADEKGIPLRLARRLSGSTREEFEADADSLLEDFGPSTPPVRQRTRENLRGGGEPDEEPQETDPAKLAANIPRF